MRGRRRDRSWELTVPILAVLKERGPASHRSILESLKVEGRVSLGATLEDAHSAACKLVAQGDAVLVSGPGSGGQHFKVRYDIRPRWDQR